MLTNERTNLVAPCSIECGICELYLCRDKQQLLGFLLTKDIPKEKLPCLGCRDVKGKCPVLGCTCETYLCAESNEVEYCYKCDSFPCSKLMPSEDRADILPHNMKVYNLCTIERIGTEGFTELS